MIFNSKYCVHVTNRNFQEILMQTFVRKASIQKYSTSLAEAVSIEDALPYNKIPGPKTLPLIGATHHFAPGGKYNGLDLSKLSAKLYEEYGDIVRIKSLPKKPDMVFIYNFDLMEKVYRAEGPWPERPPLETREHYLRKERPEVFKNVYGLLHSEGQEWQRIRSVVNQPMMQHKITRQYVGWIEEIANDFITRLSTLLDANGNAPENFMMEINKWSLESIARIAIDTRLGCLDPNLPPDSDGMKLIRTVSRLFQVAFELEVLPSFWKFVKTPKYNELMQIYDTWTEIALKYINQSIKRLEENPNKDENNLSILEKLLKKDQQVAIIMALDMFFAGIDTTASSTVTTLHKLATNQDKQNILRNELNIIFPKGSSISAEGLNQASYLKACLKESHRMKPVAVGNGRVAQKDMVLGKYFIPKGTALFLHHHFTSEIKNVYADGDKYIPERWLRTNTEGVQSAKTAHKFAYMPFGFGPRMCVGRRFAELEMQVLISRLISDYKVEWGGGELQYKSTLIHGPSGPMKFRFTPV